MLRAITSAMGFERTRGGTYFTAARRIVAMFFVTRTTARCVGTSASREKDAAMEFVPMFCPMLITVASATRSVHLVIHVGMVFVGMLERKLLEKVRDLVIHHILYSSLIYKKIKRC